MAMQGGVPIVPIVIRNTGELLWRGSTFIRPGTIDVVVHPPVSVADWSVEELDERIGEVRDLFVRTLADWPTAHPPTELNDVANPTGSAHTRSPARRR
jgi:putative phosphoserine phosphatase/1-acylglycerol-3-phosphate O-acyltransferase